MKRWLTERVEFGTIDLIVLYVCVIFLLVYTIYEVVT
jgi:hypothetical protein